MKNIVFVLFVIALLASPVFAQVNANVKGNTNVNVGDGLGVSQTVSADVEISPFDIKWRQFRDNVQDFTYNVKSKFVFSEESRVDLIKERNEQLRSRQEAWVEYKNAILHANSSVDAETRSAIRAKHEEIIREHVRLTKELNEIKAEAKTRGEARLEAKTDDVLRIHQEHKFEFGLGTDFITFLRGNEEYMNMSIMTEAEIQAKVEDMGYEFVRGELSSEDGIDVWLVEAVRVMDTGHITVTHHMYLTFDARTGMILAVSGEYEVEGEMIYPRIEIRSDMEVSDDSDRSGETETEIESGLNASVEGSFSEKFHTNFRLLGKSKLNINESETDAELSANIGVGI